MEDRIEKITFSVDFFEDEIQTFAEDNFGRELTESELNQIAQYWWEDSAVFDAKMDLIASAIKMAIEWSSKTPSKQNLDN